MDFTKLRALKSPWELILTEPVPEVVEFRPADWAEKYFSAQSAMRSSPVTLLHDVVFFIDRLSTMCKMQIAVARATQLCRPNVRTIG